MSKFASVAPEHPLSEVFPSFLTELDGNPKQAAERFYDFLSRLLTAVPPSSYTSSCAETRNDLKMQITLHCIRDSFRVLRTYKPLRRPFAVWLRQVATNQIADYYRSRYNSGSDQMPHVEMEDITYSRKDNSHRVADRDILAMVTKCLSGMDGYCQLLLQMAADEFHPREMAVALRWPHHRTKKISDDLRYCRHKLVVLLHEQGIREELIS